MNPTDSRARSVNTGGFLLGLVQVILNPRQGWLDAEKDNYSPRQLILKGFLPLLVIVACSPLISAYFKMSMTFGEAFVEGIIEFAGYFVSIYLCNYLFTWAYTIWVQPKGPNPNIVMTYVIYTISAMGLITFLTNILPIDLSLWSFLPLYVVYIIWRGEFYLRVPFDRKPQFLVCGIGTLFLPPYLLIYCLSLLA